MNILYKILNSFCFAILFFLITLLRFSNIVIAADSVEGENIARTHLTSITASHEGYSGYEDDKLVDGYLSSNADEVWLGNTNANVTLEMQFDDSYTYDTLEIYSGYSGNANANAKNMTLSGSNNGADWTKIDDYVIFNGSPSSPQYKLLNIGTQTYPYLKLLLIDNNGHASRMTLGEIMVYRSGTNLVAGATSISATTQQGSWPASNLGDEANPLINSNDYRSATNSNAEDIEIDFGSDKTFDRVEITSGSGYPTYWFGTYTIYVKADGGAYSQVDTGSTKSPLSGCYREVLDIGLQTARYVKIEARDFTFSGGVFLILSEVRIWEIGQDSGTLSTDIVDADGNSVTSPSVAMGSVNFSFPYQTATGTFGTSSQKIRVNNTTSNGSWTLSLAASNPTDKWDSSGTDYDFNDPTANAEDGADDDSLGGQLTVNASAGTLAGTCSSSGLSKGSSTAFSEGSTNNITLLTAVSADTSCYVDFTGISLSQTIPKEQPVASDYDINMVLTVVAN